VCCDPHPQVVVAVGPKGSPNEIGIKVGYPPPLFGGEPQLPFFFFPEEENGLFGNTFFFPRNNIMWGAPPPGFLKTALPNLYGGSSRKTTPVNFSPREGETNTNTSGGEHEYGLVSHPQFGGANPQPVF